MSLGAPAYSRAPRTQARHGNKRWIQFFKYYESPGKINYTKLLKLMFLLPSRCFDFGHT